MLTYRDETRRQIARCDEIDKRIVASRMALRRERHAQGCAQRREEVRLELVGGGRLPHRRRR